MSQIPPPANAPLRDELRVDPPHLAFDLGWPAYVKPMLGLFSFVILGTVTVVIAEQLWPGIALVVVGFSWFAFRSLDIASIKVFTDPDGVWVYRGILPWSRGVYGVTWRNFDEAVYIQSLTGYLTKSYKLVVTNRYTKAIEISLPNVKYGDYASGHINQMQRELAEVTSQAREEAI